MPSETYHHAHEISDAEYTMRQNERAQKFVDHVSTMNFFDEGECYELRTMTHHRFFIPLGHDTTGTIAYRIHPSYGGLELPPYKATDTHVRNALGLRAVNILDIDASAQPCLHSSADEPVKTKNLTRSMPAYMFQLLGWLEYYEDDGMPATMEDIDETLWEETGYVAVARINDEGRMSGLYVVFDEYPETDDGSGIPYKNPRKVAGHCGTMPPAEVQISCARIGDRLGEMNFGATVEWTEVANRHIALEYLVRLENGRLERISKVRG